MVKVKSVITDHELIKNMPEDMLNELIYLEDIIPDDLYSVLAWWNHDYAKAREDFLYTRPNLLYDMQMERFKRENLNISEKYDFMAEETLRFFEKYPQFKDLFVEVKVREYPD